VGVTGLNRRVSRRIVLCSWGMGFTVVVTVEGGGFAGPWAVVAGDFGIVVTLDVEVLDPPPQPQTARASTAAALARVIAILELDLADHLRRGSSRRLVGRRGADRGRYTTLSRTARRRRPRLSGDRERLSNTSWTDLHV
jgi:hypothetical protein